MTYETQPNGQRSLVDAGEHDQQRRPRRRAQHSLRFPGRPPSRLSLHGILRQHGDLLHDEGRGRPAADRRRPVHVCRDERDKEDQPDHLDERQRRRGRGEQQGLAQDFVRGRQRVRPDRGGRSGGDAGRRHGARSADQVFLPDHGPLRGRQGERSEHDGRRGRGEDRPPAGQPDRQVGGQQGPFLPGEAEHRHVRDKPGQPGRGRFRIRALPEVDQPGGRGPDPDCDADADDPLLQRREASAQFEPIPTP